MKYPKTLILKTENLKLRIPSKKDFSYIFSATRVEGFNDGMLWEPPKSEDEMIEPLERNLRNWEQGESYTFTIEDVDSGDFLGRIAIRKTKENDIWAIGFWTHPKHQEKGIMTEAAREVIRFGFEKLLAEKIEACHALWNKASEKVLKNNGMKFVRYIEKGYQKKGKWIEENLLAIDKGEFLSLKEL
jgi:ribosomal-protein-alanine N-acetyltransferase